MQLPQDAFSLLLWSLGSVLFWSAAYRISGLPRTSSSPIEPAIFSGHLIGCIGLASVFGGMVHGRSGDRSILWSALPCIYSGLASMLYHHQRRYFEIKENRYMPLSVWWVRFIFVFDTTHAAFVGVRPVAASIVSGAFDLGSSDGIARQVQAENVYYAAVAVLCIAIACAKWTWTNDFDHGLFALAGLVIQSIIDLMHADGWVLRLATGGATLTYLWMFILWARNTAAGVRPDTYPPSLMFTSHIVVGYVIMRSNISVSVLLRILPQSNAYGGGTFVSFVYSNFIAATTLFCSLVPVVVWTHVQSCRGGAEAQAGDTTTLSTHDSSVSI